MTDDKLECAINVIARGLVASILDFELDVHGAEHYWGDFGDVGEKDWVAILDRANAIAANLHAGDEAHEAAYEFLKERAEQWAKENPGEIL